MATDNSPFIDNLPIKSPFVGGFSAPWIFRCPVESVDSASRSQLGTVARAPSDSDFRVGAPRERNGWDQKDFGPALSDAATRGW